MVFYMVLLFTFATYTHFVASDSALWPYSPVKSETLGDDCGDPLFLTPLITSGQLDKARKLAVVPKNQTRFMSVNSSAGYFTVNQKTGSNMFFWYIEAAKNPETVPVVLWLQGGPGASSLYGAFFENGPFAFRGRHIKKRPFSWHNVNNMIYIDNPVGTGYSFTKNGYAQNEADVGNDLYNALIQFFTLYPSLQNNDFYVTGESYAGKYVPAVSYAIHKNNMNARLKINLKGFAIGNGLCDPINQLKYSDYLYQIGLVDTNGKNSIANYETKGINFIKNKQWQNAYEIFDTLINGDLTPYNSLFYNLTGFKYYFNYLKSIDMEKSSYFEKLIQTPGVRSSWHVGKTEFSDGKEVQKNLQLDMMQSVADWVSELLSHYRGLIYNGQLDIIIGYPLTENFVRNLKFSSSDDYLRAERKKWIVNDEIAGYAKVAGNLTEVLVRNAGHMVPSDQPKWAFDLITRFTRNKPFF